MFFKNQTSDIIGYYIRDQCVVTIEYFQFSSDCVNELHKNTCSPFLLVMIMQKTGVTRGVISVVIQRVIKSSPEGTRLYYELNYVLIPRLLIGTNIYYGFVLLQG